MLRYILKMVNGFFLNTGSVEARLSPAVVIPLEEVSIYNNLLFVFIPQGKKKSVTVCGVSGTKNVSVTRKNLLWEQFCRYVIAH